MSAKLFLSLCFAVTLSVSAQEPVPTPSAKSGSAKPASAKANVAQPAKPKLTDAQKQGLDLLETAEATTAGLEGPSRIVAYSQIARSYQAIDKKKAVELLEQAYDSLRTLQFDSPDQNLNNMIRGQLEQQVLNQLADTAPERLDTLLDEMDSSSRISALRVLLSYYEKNKNLDRPVAILLQLGAQGEMPLQLADDVIEKLGTSHPEQVRELFFSAMASYARQQHSGGVDGSGEPARLIARMYGRVPDNNLEDAIDQVLSLARKADEDGEKVSISMGFDKGAVQFKSKYDVELFELLPTLQKLNPEKAQRLLKDSMDVNTFISKYPQGMNSLSENGKPTSVSTFTGDSVASGAQSTQMLEEQSLNRINRDAADHPNDALANAATLSPRYALSAYLSIAHANAKKNSAVAASALAKAQETLPRSSLEDRMRFILQIVYAYENLGDKESAEKAIELGTKTVAEMYKRETDADDPNLAPKAYWESSNAMRSLVDASYKLDPLRAAALLKASPDDEIRVFAEIALARRLMGSEGSTMDFSINATKARWSVTTSIVN